MALCGTAHRYRIARAAVAVSMLLAGPPGVVRAALGMDCARPVSSPTAVIPRDGSRAHISEPTPESGGEERPAGLPSAFTASSCQTPGSLHPDPPALEAAMATGSDRVAAVHQRIVSDWEAPPPFHPPRRG